MPFSTADTTIIRPFEVENGWAWRDLARKDRGPLPEIKTHTYPGLYIVFEGTGGTGKDTISWAIQRRLEGADTNGPYKGPLYPELPVSKIRSTHEPGGSRDAEVLREILKTIRLPLELQLELFRMARESSLKEAVQPTLESGGVVLQVRSALSSFAYQGFGEGAGPERVLKCNRFFLESFVPDIVVHVERDVETAIAQTVDEGGKRDVFDEDVEYNRRVQEGYRKAREVFGVCDWIWIDNSMGIYDMQQTIDIVWAQLQFKIHSWYVKTYGITK